MKRINFIAPVESMRGNLSGEQNLEYAENNNPAFDAPNGKQYARNYVTRYIGARRAKDGRAYFAVKRSAAVNVSVMAKFRWALLGGTQACYAAILKDASLLASIDRVYRWNVDVTGLTKTFAQWARDIIRAGLNSKSELFSFGGGTGSGGPIKVYNPWIYKITPTTGGETITIKQEILAKFWDQLANNPIHIVITNEVKTGMPEKMYIYAHEFETWTHYTQSDYNIYKILTEASGTGVVPSEFPEDVALYSGGGASEPTKVTKTSQISTTSIYTWEIEGE